MKILVANIGSTSLKYRLFDFEDDVGELVARGGFERVKDYPDAIDKCLQELKKSGAIRVETDVSAVGFKTVVAEGITGCVALNEDVIRAMERVNVVAPAHNPPYIKGIRFFSQRMPGIPLVGLFETAFYQWAPAAAQRYAVPDDWHEYGVQRLGFHGASHKFVAEQSASLLGRKDVAARARELYSGGLDLPVEGRDLRVISCHMGGSSSVTGILNGVAIGNSFGMSPQSGLPHNNRVGDLDPFAIPLLIKLRGMSLDEILETLCNESGLQAISGGYNDLRDIQDQADKGNPKAQLAQDVLVQQTRHWIGAFYAELNGIDALVFTGGIGENRTIIREMICAHLDQLGIVLDPFINDQTQALQAVISSPNSKVKVMVIPANEELVVAREVHRFLSKQTRDERLIDQLDMAAHPVGKKAATNGNTD